MSMHDVEDLLEKAVGLLHESGRDDLRSLYFGLFADFARLPILDVGFVEMRVIDMLLHDHYAYRISSSDYPAYQGIGYDDGQLSYAFAGDALWERLAADGLLSGDDSEPPGAWRDPITVTYALFTEAEQRADRDFVSQWYPAFLLWLSFAVAGSQLEHLLDDADLQAIMDIVLRMDANLPPSGDLAFFSPFPPPLPTTPADFVAALKASLDDAE